MNAERVGGGEGEREGEGERKREGGREGERKERAEYREGVMEGKGQRVCGKEEGP